MALASLILGIAALVLSWEGYGAFVGLACGILAIVFGNIAKKDTQQNQTQTTQATIGRILGWTAVIISIIVLVIFIGLVGVAGVFFTKLLSHI